MATWADRLAATLAGAGPAPTPDGREVRITLQVEGSTPAAATLVLSPAGSRVEPAVERPDATVRLDAAGADELASGSTVMAVLREGRVRVSGDVSVVVALADWLAGHRPA